MGRITRQLLRASRLAGAPAGEHAAMLDEAVRRAVDVARERGRLPEAIAIDVPAGLEVDVEAAVLVEVIASALDEAAASGGRVEVRAPTPTTRSHVDLVVDDDGPPMPPLELASALEPLAATRAGPAALGPSICRALLVGHGGDLAIGARPGGGTRIVATLPRATRGAPARAA